ncbi:RNA 2',3'-cyclic phosphodiesterase [Evansella sp. LMS18]|uniref:RNA 2',3'-cyclic phosphodiesterase n=1 Tax=Evansella sp. LMS18 TaxID=2924033 RepID=UPI0020D01E93|nr:RNA 2',3'-cyclic phosphodiesterase [Evansella sp. LMS18]UTR11440.1 RNA 2',3'-cyclic phosphodiesterase [Evansella sp. LMS18]
MGSPHFFIGIPVPENISSYLEELQQQLSLENYFKKITHAEDFHITLLFLGDWGKEGERESLWSTLADRLAKEEPFKLTLDQTGFFGSKNKPRVFWAGISGEQPLSRIQEKTAGKAEEHGFKREKRPYRPHITLAKSYNTDNDFTESTGTNLNNMEWLVEEVILYEVQPGKKPMYKPVSKIRFSG